MAVKQNANVQTGSNGADLQVKEGLDERQQGVDDTACNCI